MAVQFDVISPDGFSINREGFYPTESEAKIGLTEWVKRYERQGYYSSVPYGRIPLDQIEIYCKIIPVEVEEDDDQDTEHGPF